MMEKEQLVAYCGLYCGLCDQRTKIPKQAAALLQAMQKAEYDDWGPHLPNFSEFWAFLKELSVIEEGKHCRDGQCGERFCAIKKCAREKGVGMCVECADYPCKWIMKLAKGEPTLLHDNQRLKERGLEEWIEEQEARRAAGFCYGDIRCFPYDFPFREDEED